MSESIAADGRHPAVLKGQFRYLPMDLVHFGPGTSRYIRWPAIHVHSLKCEQLGLHGLVPCDW